MQIALCLLIARKSSTMNQENSCCEILEEKKDLKNSVFVHKSIFDLKRLSWNDNALEESRLPRAILLLLSLSLLLDVIDPKN